MSVGVDHSHKLLRLRAAIVETVFLVVEHLGTNTNFHSPATRGQSNTQTVQEHLALSAPTLSQLAEPLSRAKQSNWPPRSPPPSPPAKLMVSSVSPSATSTP